MNKFRSICWTFLTLLVILPTTCAAASQTAASSQRVLTFSPKAPHASSFFLKSPRGVTYRLSLVPRFDVTNRAVVLELALQNRDNRRIKSNLDSNLLWTGKLHGYQPCFFAASDFAHGAKKSLYGELRVIRLPKLGMEIRIKVADVRVESLLGPSADAFGYQFDYLSLEITAGTLT